MKDVVYEISFTLDGDVFNIKTALVAAENITQAVDYLKVKHKKHDFHMLTYYRR